ncbi:hypothetical protein Taro_011449 [Colocasia esculenta]|uniref:Glutamine amidotransferase domain-containing protein n=1 Tax=Colocasia esculenta TaxID=4460 RepID=A0A843U6B8_COLES|nr:hypothetical protein [Colocasia esculenta]
MPSGQGEAMEKRRFAVLLCAEDSDYVTKRYGGYFGVFVGLLGEEGEAWDVFRVCQGEFPADDDLSRYDGFVITGSCCDAHGEDAWIRRLVSLLQRLDAMRKKILARAMGGKTGRSAKGWDLGVTTINLSSKASELLLSPLNAPPALRIIQCHRDEVKELPERAEIMARSEKTGVEMFRCGDHIMGMQGHPEYNRDILHHLLDRLLQRGLIQSWHVEAAKASVGTQQPDQEAWKRLCKGFLKSTS